MCSYDAPKLQKQCLRLMSMHAIQITHAVAARPVRASLRSVHFVLRMNRLHAWQPALLMLLSLSKLSSSTQVGLLLLVPSA